MHACSLFGFIYGDCTVPALSLIIEYGSDILNLLSAFSSFAVLASDQVESSSVETPTAEASVCNEPPSNAADDDNVWTKPLPVTEDKSRFARLGLHLVSKLDSFYN